MHDNECKVKACNVYACNGKIHIWVINAYNGMDYRGNACLGINNRAWHHRARH
jgi:hypothetical protein